MYSRCSLNIFFFFFLNTSEWVNKSIHIHWLKKLLEIHENTKNKSLLLSYCSDNQCQFYIYIYISAQIFKLHMCMYLKWDILYTPKYIFNVVSVILQSFSVSTFFSEILKAQPGFEKGDVYLGTMAKARPQNLKSQTKTIEWAYPPSSNLTHAWKRPLVFS